MNDRQRAAGTTLSLMMVLIVVGVAFRLLPHAPNFTPIAACALLAGAVIKDRRLALLVPLLALFISDLLLGFYEPVVMAAIYVGLSLPILLGSYLRNHRSVLRIGGLSVCGSLLFFVISNFAVWAFLSYYPKSLDGLVVCYTSAIPFFRNSLTGNLFWSYSLFATYALLFESERVAKGQLLVKTLFAAPERAT